MAVFRRKEISFGNISDSVLFPASNVNFSGGLKLTIKNKRADVSVKAVPVNMQPPTTQTQEYPEKLQRMCVLLKFCYDSARRIVCKWNGKES
jgi:hypothetical protein